MSENIKYFISSKRLGFSFWRAEDFAKAEKLWGNAQVTRWIDQKGFMTQEQIRRRFEQEIENQDCFKAQYWPVYSKETNEFLGCCGLRPYDLAQGIWELGVHLLPCAWGKGIATEASECVISYSRKQPLIKALFAGHNPNNAASAKILRKLGFVYTKDEFYPPTGLMHPSYRLNLESDCSHCFRCLSNPEDKTF